LQLDSKAPLVIDGDYVNLDKMVFKEIK